MNPPRLARRAFKKYRTEGLRSVIAAVPRQVKQTVQGDRFFRHMTALRYWKQRRLYDAPAHPYKVIHVDLDDIVYFNEAIDTSWGLGIIKGGDWDTEDNCNPILSTTHYRGFKQRFEEGYDWEDTVYYRQRENFLSGIETERLDYIEQLYEDITQNGYRPNYEAGHDAPDVGGRQSRFRHLHSLEPFVAIGRDGEVYLSEGFHRLAIAKLAGIEQIPVNVLARHERWQQQREEIHERLRADTYPEENRHLSHPDLKDVIDESEPR